MAKHYQMQLTVKEFYDLETKERTYEYEIYDGPDGIEYSSGVTKSIGECFEKIVQDRYATYLSYR